MTRTMRRRGNPAGANAGRKQARARGHGFGLGRPCVYWGAVLGLWGAIAAVGAWRLGRRASAADPGAGNSEAAADHPDHRPRRQRAGDPRRNGRRQCRAEGPAALSAEGLHRHRGPPVLFALRRRPHRHPARGGHQRPASRRLAGRLDADPAARQEPVPDPGAHAAAQTAGSRTGALAGAQAFQERRSSNSISTGSISAPAPMASRRPRSAISANRPGTSPWRKPRCWRGWSNRRRGWRRTATRKAPRSARRPCSPPWRTPSSSPRRRRRRRSATPPTSVKPAGAGTVNYVADWIGEVLDDLVGQIDQNIVVETTIDPKLQAVAEAAVIDELAAKSVKFNVSQGALVAMTPDGAVRAMVGGRNYAESQYNRAVTAKRQPGSAFKPFVYLTAIEAGPDAGHDPAGRAARRQGLEAGELQPRIFRRGDADAGAGDVAQHGRGAAGARSRAEERGAHRAPARHFLASSTPMPRSRSAPRKSRCSNWSAPMRRSPMAASASRRMS